MDRGWSSVPAGCRCRRPVQGSLGGNYDEVAPTRIGRPFQLSARCRRPPREQAVRFDPGRSVPRGRGHRRPRRAGCRSVARIAVLRQRAGDAPGCADALIDGACRGPGHRRRRCNARSRLPGSRVPEAKTGNSPWSGARQPHRRSRRSSPGAAGGARVCVLDELAMAEAEAGDVAAAVVLAERCPHGSGSGNRIGYSTGSPGLHRRQER